MMTFQFLIDSLQDDTLRSMKAFAPELVLCATIVLMLVIRLFTRGHRDNEISVVLSSWLPLVGTTVALFMAAPWRYLSEPGLAAAQIPSGEIFTGLLVFDELGIYLRSFLILFALLFVLFTRISGIPDLEDGVDFYSLVLGSTVGMCLMVTANHLLIVFLGVEMASVPAYVLSGMLKGRRQASEAALKFVVYGAGAAGIMLYGISLLAGILGTVHLPTASLRLAQLLQAGTLSEQIPVLVLAGFMIMVGLAFKLSAVPFHFWCPDVFEGASAEVDAFLSVASKGAALGLLVRLALGFGHVGMDPAMVETAVVETVANETVVNETAMVETVEHETATVETTTTDTATIPVALLAEEPAVPADGESASGLSQSELTAALEPARGFMAALIGFLAAITCTFGNLAAYGQTNIKRLLAYSTIAHAGYMMMPVAAAVALVGQQPEVAQEAIGSLTYYIAAYLFMNLSAFAIVAFLRNAIHSERIADYAGLLKRSPVVVLCFCLVLFSLIGMPPLIGFLAKAQIFLALVSAKMWWLLAIGGLNAVISLFYYLRVIKTLTIDPEPEDRLPDSFPMPWSATIFTLAVSLPTIVLFFSNDLIRWSSSAAAHLFS